ncbi:MULTISPECIES: hypothetical protein [unclassified Novosphingobium]|uniref:hypothetical protein n=1 Tax=unclassified Novosphingobium TaxID=2644732 RepID=UPI0025D8A32E|nr:MULTISPECIES: hypothetical protein [unclassified Novosphingobium]HQV03314.1 hypothetical protein [Novosphingobium sp.]
MEVQRSVNVAGTNLPPELHPLVDLILAREDLQERLGAEIEANAFIAAAGAVASENGIAISEDQLRAVLRPDPLGMGRFGPAPIEMTDWPPRGWLPTRSVFMPEGPAFDWLWFGGQPLNQPFFEDEVRRASALPLNWLLRIRTGLPALIAGAESHDSLPLQGMVFHMSRCGSTLAAQMLGAVPGHAVSSEPEPLDAVLRWSAESGVGLDQAKTAVSAIIAALGRDRGHGANHHFIKMEVWHTLFLPLLRQALPQVNWIYLHRDPVEVLVSLRDMPSHHIVPSVIPAGYFGLNELPDLPHDEFASFVLAQVTAAVPAHWHLGGGMVIDYPDIRTAIPTRVAVHFGLTLAADELALVRQASMRDAKAPGSVFFDDSARKRAAAGPELISAAERWLKPMRNRLIELQG